MVRKGLKITPFKRCGNYIVSTAAKRTDLRSTVISIQRAHSSVKRWLNTPVTHITRFRKYICNKEQVSALEQDRQQNRVVNDLVKDSAM